MLIATYNSSLMIGVFCFSFAEAIQNSIQSEIVDLLFVSVRIDCVIGHTEECRFLKIDFV